MNSESSSPLPALPVRRRETLEIFDTALKLYRRYFWVLIGWSALVSSLAFVPFLSFFSFFLMPLLYGAVSCCVAAAVRGQNVKFSQCWAFSKPRYGALLGTVFLSYLTFSALILVLWIVSALVGVLGALALSNAPEPVQIVGTVIGVVLGLVAFSVAGVVAFGWMNMVPVVVCLEDDKRSSAAMGRAFDLLKGQWRRVFGLSLILGLAVMAVFIIVGGVYFLFGVGATGIFSSNAPDSAILGLMGTFGAFLGLFFLLWNPAQTLVIAVLYLDLRVRREALDLEWTAYASAPVPSPDAALNAAPTPVYIPPSSGASGDSAFENASPASFGAGKSEVAPAPALETPILPLERENEAPRD